jgi:predicted metal-dependent hydrolase
MNSELPAYTLVSSRRRRSVAIMIDPERGAVVYAPHGIGESVLENLLQQKRDWMIKKLERIKMQASQPKAHFAGDRQDAARIIKERVAFYSAQLRLFPEKISIRDQRRRWGSCSARTGSVNFCWRLVMAPVEVLDYVVIHELSHLRHPDHSPEFWAHVAQFVPDYKARRKWLRVNGSQLVP